LLSSEIVALLAFKALAFEGRLIPIRSCQKCSKQFCLWDLAQSIGILFIIQIVGAI